MKQRKLIALVLTLALALTLCACGQSAQEPENAQTTRIVLSDSAITVDGAAAGTDPAGAVYVANDIVYYEAGKDFTYGEGTEQDAHTPEEAAAHQVVHITQPGTYSLSGTLSLGQIAVDLGDGAKKDPSAVVTLVLEGMDITCQVAPAVIFYNVYECGSDDTETAAKDVDTSAAGANVIIADGTVNNVRGSYVARIYEPDSVVLSEDGTEVEDADKLHKYDAAFYSKRSMNVSGGEAGTGELNIRAENEGLDSELHLTINGGIISITAGNDGINTNEDGVSVTTVNGGSLSILVTGETGEGDGIDSNGWLVINGGTVVAAACATSGDAGIDSDMGIHINGGTVVATGHMLDRIEDGGQTYAVFQFAQQQTGSETIRLKDEKGNGLLETVPENAYSILVYSSPGLAAGSYTLWSDEAQLAGSSSGSMMGGMPGGMGRPDQPTGGQQFPGEGMTPPEGMEMPGEGMTPPEGMEMPGEGKMPTEGGMPGGFEGGMPEDMALQPEFVLRDGGNQFSGVTRYSPV